MATVHFRRLQTPLCSEWHLSTIKATLHQINEVLEDSDERQSVLTSLYQAKDFQIVLGIVKEWYLESLRALLVNGRWAIEDTKHQLIRYVSSYCSKPQLEWQLRGSIHLHYLVWRVMDEEL